MYRLLWSKHAVKDLSSLPQKQRELIYSWAVKNLDGCVNPRAVSNGKILAGTKNGWHYRVGSYRIICEIKDNELTINALRVGHRQGVYKNLPNI